MIRNMYASGSSPVAAASCRTCSFARLAAPLGRPAPGRFPPCPFIVLSRGRPKTAAVQFGIRFIYTTLRYSERVEEILAEEDEAELARSNDEWRERFQNTVRDDALITEFGT